MKHRLLADLFPVENPEAVLVEVCTFFRQASSGFDPSPIRRLYRNALRLYRGQWPGYRQCDTEYHDFVHAAGVFLAMARLIHGVMLQKDRFDPRYTLAALAAAILHDSGYILTDGESLNTGAAHRQVHEKRSMDFLARHGAEIGLSPVEIEAGKVMIQCTDMEVDIRTIAFPSPEVAFLGRMLAVADLAAQLSEQTYLEKLPLLYAEDVASGAPEYTGETDTIRRAVSFYRVACRRIETAHEGWNALLRDHFADRWGQSENLYQVAITRQKNRLESILAEPDADPRSFLRRTGTLQKARRIYTLE